MVTQLTAYAIAIGIIKVALTWFRCNTVTTCIVWAANTLITKVECIIKGIKAACEILVNISTQSIRTEIR